MASLAHVFVGLAAARIAAPREAKLPPRELAIVFSGLALLPDADVVAFALGVPYHSQWGHRGFTHSLVFAALVGVVALALTRSWKAGLLVGLTVATHGPLDTLTDGGLGAAVFWPFTDARYFAPWRPIPVAPIGLGFISREGLACAWVETMAFFPLWLWAIWPRRRAPGPPTSSSGTSP